MVDSTHFTIVGAGLAGTLLALLLAQRGHRVEVVERRSDPRKGTVERGRSINLALAARGLHALQLAGLAAEVRRLCIPMRGRMVHDLQGHQALVPYGQGPHEVIYSVSRGGLNELLLDAAEAQQNIEIRFASPVEKLELANHGVRLAVGPGSLTAHHVIAADGAGSAVRRAMIDSQLTRANVEMLTHGYKELTIPAAADGTHRLDGESLHIWPRGGFMLIALPNLDGTFTVTLFLAHEVTPGFAQLRTAADVRSFLETHFADAARLMPSLTDEFFAHPVGEMGTVRTERWAIDDRLLLVGDAAHAIVPFHGQGMNCALEDCVRLVELLDTENDVTAAFQRFERERRPQANAIADMAIENYVEMRDTVRDPKFLLQRSLSLELERRHPDRFVPRYSMVMFHHEIPYADAQERGAIQREILQTLTMNAAALGEIDYDRARQLILERLSPLHS